MNRYEIENEIVQLNNKINSMEKDLAQFGSVLGASSQLGIILRLVDLKDEIKSLESMLDVLVFEEITKNF